MIKREPTRRTTRRARWIVVAGLVAVVVANVYRPLASSPSTTTAPIEVLHFDHPAAPAESGGAIPDGPIVVRVDHRGALGEADGIVPDGATVFDAELPAVARLDPDLLRALRQAATAAADDGIALFVVSGWRSPAYQDALLREAISKYGSEAEAARWVATADTSPHVSGDAVDIEPYDAMGWLSRHGGRYGLCQIYRNEPWHYELRPSATERGCPRMYADPTDDPRMQE
jgi:zinc D-Ala-D-Ala carboxypeptidase